jgi:hypothetical protein
MHAFLISVPEDTHAYTHHWLVRLGVTRIVAQRRCTLQEDEQDKEEEDKEGSAGSAWMHRQ